ncbi:DUF397 domain-containing protein [Thermopolyspora sp. NPDC052614]|uniref:DUF397 domain-containing protein n=1 Tax=Thermopolyspora sp. NPDC052614 TaxID=3155682 RepID=UPI003435FF83
MTREEEHTKKAISACARWRVSGRSDGSTTCVEAATDGVTVALGNSSERHPHRPVLHVAVQEWLDFLDQVRAGHVDRSMILSPKIAGPFVVHTTDSGLIEVQCTEEPDGPRLRYTPEEWDVFVSGVTQNGEFDIDWLLSETRAMSTLG